MLKGIVGGTLFALLFMGCVSTSEKRPAPQEIIVRVESTGPARVTVSKEGTQVTKSMEVPNQQGHLSALSFISGNMFVSILAILHNFGCQEFLFLRVSNSHHKTAMSMDFTYCPVR